jgi:hypothetical protein
VGRLPIEDPTKVHLLALDTGDPLEFQWHVYIPAGVDAIWKLEYPGGSSTSSGMTSVSQTSLVRVRFRETGGRWQMWAQYGQGSSLADFQDGALFDQAESLVFEQLGQGTTTVLEMDQIATLLKITTGDKPLPDGRDEPLLDFRFGSRSAWAKEQDQGQ